MNSILVSVVVPTFQRPELLARCLYALTNQDFDPGGYEIIVVDGAGSEEIRDLVQGWARGSTAKSWNETVPELSPIHLGQPNNEPRTKPLSRPAIVEFQDFPEVRYIPIHGKKGPASARNCGWRAAQGEIIAFTEDDCIPSPYWIRCGVRAFEDQVVGVSGQVIVPYPPAPTEYERSTADLERLDFSTANSFYRREVLERLEGFDERFSFPSREGTDLFFSLLEQNCQLARSPVAIVFHPVRDVPPGVSLGKQKKQQFQPLLFKKHPHSYRSRIRAPFLKRLYYPASAAMATSGLAALVGIWWLMELALAVWVVLCTYLCILRLRNTSRSAAHVIEMFVTSLFIPPLAVIWRLVGMARFKVLLL